MKRLPALLLFLIFILSALHDHAANIYVSPQGSDKNPGTKEQPLASIALALRKARELRRLNDTSVEAGIHIILAGGIYHLYEPLFIRSEDAGTAASPTFIEAASGANPVVSGGIGVSHWKKAINTIPGLPAAAQGKVWVANLPFINGQLPAFRQLWVNNVKAVCAKSTNGALMKRILSWNKTEQTCWIPTPATVSLKNVTGMELFIHQWWAIATLRIKNIEVHADSTKLQFYQPESRIESEHPWPAPWISAETGNSAFYLYNAIQFLDEPGEWWLDKTQHSIYYWPRQGEDLQKDSSTIPALETLVVIQGTLEHPVLNVFFNGISFQHTGWLRPAQYGHVPHQAGMYMLDAYKLAIPGTADKKTLENQAWVGRPAAAVQVSFADSTGFENCRFEHLAATGIDYAKYTAHSIITGNLFKDIGGTAILAGVFSDEAIEIHTPYNPLNEKEICSNLVISNNLVTNVTNEDWGCVGIGAGWVKDIQITHNEISDVSYSGISVGWGWTKTLNAMKRNTISFNKIHHYGKHNYDCAGIYTLSAQPGSVISNNYIDSIYKAPYAHLPNHWFYLYTDEGSAYFTVKDNWCPSPKFLQNANGPGNSWANNGPQVDRPLVATAGLEPAYQYLAKEKIADELPAINKAHPVIIEMILPTGRALDTGTVHALMSQYGIKPPALNHWKQHWVIFGEVGDAAALKKNLNAALPGVETKIYDDMFYAFDRSRCSDTVTAREWEHSILTANLVADRKLQNEYLAAHATQFEKWPEVANGFCHAGFQQVLVFRNGRQLMLVISTPKGTSLATLNPKTTENNPRMDAWNQHMKKYQEGIAGTGKGETWILLQPAK